MTKVDDFRFNDWPQKIERSKYDAVVEKYVQKLEKCTDVISVYQWGSISTPGISDIDLLIVVKDNPSKFNWKEYSAKYNREDEEMRRLFLHEPFVVCESIASRVKWLLPATNLTLLRGVEFDFQEASRWSLFHFLLTIFIQGYITWPQRVFAGKKVNLRHMIPTLSGTKWTIQLIDSLPMGIGHFSIQEKSFFDSFSSMVLQYKENYFSLDNDDVKLIFLDLCAKAERLHDLIYFKLVNEIFPAMFEGSRLPRFYFYGLGPLLSFIIFHGRQKMSEIGPFRFIGEGFSIALPQCVHRIKDPVMREGFMERIKVVRMYEKFLYTNNIHNFAIGMGVLKSRISFSQFYQKIIRKFFNG